MKKLALLLGFAMSATASVTVTVSPTGFATPLNSYIRADIVNCQNPTIVNSGITVPASRKFPLLGAVSIPITIEDNVTQIACNGNQLSYYTFTYVLAPGNEMLLKSVELPPGVFNLANLAPVTTPPWNPGIIQGPPGLPGADGSEFNGGTLTQPLILAGSPTVSLGAATKGYADGLFATAVPRSLFAGTGTNCLLDNLTFGSCGSGGSPTPAGVSSATGLLYTSSTLTNASAFALSGTRAVISGTTGDNLQPCPLSGANQVGISYNYGSGTSIYPVNGQVNYNCYQLGYNTAGILDDIRAPVVPGINGGGFVYGHVYLNTSTGAGNDISGQWTTFQPNVNISNFNSAGINQYRTEGLYVTSVGDSGRYAYLHPVGGGAEDGNAEGVLLTDQMLVDGSVKVQPNAAYANTVNEIFITETSACGSGELGFRKTCVGPIRPLLKTSTAIALTATAITQPGDNNGVWGTITVPANSALTPYIPTATAKLGAAMTSASYIQAVTGQTTTVSLTNITGTFPSSGTNYGCIHDFDGAGYGMEPVRYIVSGSNLTVYTQRWPHSVGALLTNTPCMYADSINDTLAMGSRAVVYAMPVSTTQINYKTQVEGHTSGSWFGRLAFNPGVNDNKFEIMLGTPIVSVGNPTPAAGLSPVVYDGYMRLADHSFPIAVEQMEVGTFLAQKVAVSRKVYSPLQASDGFSGNNAEILEVTGPTDVAHYTTIADPNGNSSYARFSPVRAERQVVSGSGSPSIYNVLDEIDVEPNVSLLNIADYRNGGCNHSFATFSDNRTGAFINYDCSPSAHAPNVTVGGYPGGWTFTNLVNFAGGSASGTPTAYYNNGAFNPPASSVSISAYMNYTNGGGSPITTLSHATFGSTGTGLTILRDIGTANNGFSTATGGNIANSVIVNQGESAIAVHDGGTNVWNMIKVPTAYQGRVTLASSPQTVTFPTNMFATGFPPICTASDETAVAAVRTATPTITGFALSGSVGDSIAFRCSQ